MQSIFICPNPKHTNGLTAVKAEEVVSTEKNDTYFRLHDCTKEIRGALAFLNVVPIKLIAKLYVSVNNQKKS